MVIFYRNNHIQVISRPCNWALAMPSQPNAPILSLLYPIISHDIITPARGPKQCGLNTYHKNPLSVDTLFGNYKKLA